MTACIVGWSHTPFGKHEGEDVESLILKVATAAVADAGAGGRRHRRTRAGHLQRGLLAPGLPRLAWCCRQTSAFRFKPATRVENACATGSAAVHQA